VNNVNSVCFALLNTQGLITKSSNKLNSPEVIDFFANKDIVFFTETWGCDDFNCEVNSFRHFVVNRSRKLIGTTRNSGGVIIYIRNDLCNNDTCM